MEKEDILLNSDQEDTYTVDEAVNEMGFGPFQVLITIFCGLIWVADAMEVMILAILSPILKCQWELTTIEQAAIPSVVFLGVMTGVIFWGFLNDLIGRKKSLLTVDICVLIFGLLSAAQVSSDDGRIPGYPWLLICRFGVGFSSGGTTQVITYYAEFLPQKKRGFWLVMIAVWWTIGGIFCAVLAILVLRVWRLNWHWYLGLSASPMAIVLVLFLFVPESARFYLIKGKNEKAQKVIETIAKLNCKKPPSGILVIEEDARVIQVGSKLPEKLNINGGIKGKEKSEALQTINSENNRVEEDNTLHDEEVSKLLQESNKSEKLWEKQSKLLTGLRQIFVKNMWRTTTILMGIWFGGALSYYGVILLTTTMLSSNPHCETNDTKNSSNCTELDTGDYVKILLASAAEFPGLILTFLIIDILGRKKSMALEFLLAAGSFSLLLICTSDTVLVVFLFIVRAFVTGTFQVIHVYTPEVYPTEVRGLALGVCNIAARIGGILTPVVAQVIFEANNYVSISLYAGSCVLFAIMAMLLPIETKGKPLKDK